MKRIVAMLFAVLIVGCGQTWAAWGAKIGVVDLQKAVSECRSGANARAVLLKRTEELNDELKAKLAELEKEKTAFDKDASRLSESARAEKERRLQKTGRELQDRRRDAQEEVKQLEADSLRKVVGQLNDLMARIGVEGGYAAILDKRNGVFYSSGEIDLTSALIKRADAEYGK